MSVLAASREALRKTDLRRRIGWVREMQGLAIDALGPDAAVGELCRILVRTHTDPSAAAGRVDEPAGVLAEVVGLKPGRVTLMPYGPAEGIAAGCEVHALGADSQIGVGPAFASSIASASRSTGCPSRSQRSVARCGACRSTR